jgi:hypothetical protein
MSTESPRRASALKRTTALVSTGLLAAAMLFGGTTAAQAIADPSLESSSSTATAGGTVVLTASGFEPGTELSFFVDDEQNELTTYPVDGTEVAAGDDGTYEGYATLPETLEPGTHEILVLNRAFFDREELPFGASTEITIVAQPTSSVTPASQSLSSYLKNGVTATFTGFEPGATVSFGIGNEGSGDQAGPDQVADANGTVVLRFVPEVGTNYANEGTYFLSAFSNGFAVSAAPVSFVVTADAAATPSAPVAAPAKPVKRAATFTG